MLENVAIVATHGVEPFGLGAYIEVWGEPEHPEDDVPVFNTTICSDRPGRIRSRIGFDIHLDAGLEALESADLIALAASEHFLDPPSDELSAALCEAHARGARILAACTATFMLAHTGLLDGRPCTTHWRHGERLQEMFPLIHVEPDKLFNTVDGITTGAGAAAQIDASLHVMREEFGSRVAATVARRIVVPPVREGGQAQFIRTPVAPCEDEALAPVLGWAVDNLSEPLTVELLARRALMSTRTFARRFRDQTGVTPHQWVTQQRLSQAEALLEETSLSIEDIAQRSGFATGATLRYQFQSARGISPQQYRARFTCAS